jgi:hypothetical protein
MKNDGLVIGPALSSHTNLFRDKCEVMRTFDSFRNIRLRAGLKSQDGRAGRKSVAGTGTPKLDEHGQEPPR